MLLILCLLANGVAFADPFIDFNYFGKEAVQVLVNIVLLPFRIIQAVFDPPPVRYPVLIPSCYAPPPYYAPVSNGYVVAAPSVVRPNSPPLDPAAVSNVKGSVEVKIPNADGTFTLVILRQTEKGFLGPQGEFYADQPTADQLRGRYTKK